MIVREVNYICEPRNITIDAHFPLSSTHVEISLKVDDILAIKKSYRTKSYPSKRDEYNKFVEAFCYMYINFCEDDLYYNVEEYMPSLYAHRNLKKVLNKSGKTIWTRP